MLQHQVFLFLPPIFAFILIFFSGKIFTIKRTWDYLYLNCAFIALTIFNAITLFASSTLISLNATSKSTFLITIGLSRDAFFALLLFIASIFYQKIIERKQIRFLVFFSYSAFFIISFLIIASISYLAAIPNEFILHETVPLVFRIATAVFHSFTVARITDRYLRTKYLSDFWYISAAGCFLFSILYTIFNYNELYLFSDISIGLHSLGLLSFYFMIFNEHSRFIETETQIRVSLEKELHETENRFQDLHNLLNEISAGIFVLDATGTIIYCNQSLSKMFKLPIKAVQQLSYTNLFDKANLDKFQLEQEKWREGVASQIEIEFSSNKAPHIQVLMSGTPILDKKRHFIGSRHVVIEMSRWKEIEKGLVVRSENLEKIIRQRTEALKKKNDEYEQTTNYYESLISGMLDILLVMDDKGRCTFINEYGQKMLGYQAEELTGQKLPEFFTDVKQLKKNYGDSVNFELRDYECPLQSKDGQQLQLSWNVRYLFDVNRKPVGTMYVGRDIIEKKQLQQRIQEHTKNLESLVAQRTKELDLKVRQMAKIIEIGEDIVLNLDLKIILGNISEAIKALGWEIVIISVRNFEAKDSRVVASVGISGKRFQEISAENKMSFKEVLTLMNDEYKISNSYFVSHAIHKFSLSGRLRGKLSFIKRNENQWHPDDTLLVPIKIKNKMLGFIAVQSPADGLKPNIDKVQLLEIFANKAAVVIENARLFKQVRGKAGEMERISELKSKLLADMSHELRTPLNSILSLTRILLKEIPGKLNPDQVKQISIIERNGKNLLNLINNLLDLSKFEAGKMQLNYHCFSIVDLLHATTEMIRPLCENKGLKLAVSISKRLPKYILSDSDKISQILTNLLSNAVKFTERGKITISAKPEKSSTSLSLIIRDTGVGISKENMHALFNDYQQLDNVALTNAKGTGLGLSITRKIVDLLEGKIEIDSQPNKGTIVKLQLPMKAVGEQQMAQTESDDTVKIHFALDEFGAISEKKSPGTISRKTEISMDGSAGAARSKMNKADVSAKKTGSVPAPSRKSVNSASAQKHILLVDDNEDNQYAMSYFLRERGYRISFASNGREGVEKAVELKPSLILMDIMMPGLDGYQATKILKSRKDSAKIPIIAMTAKAMHEDQFKALQAGCDDYISKPFSLEQIARKIQKWV